MFFYQDYEDTSSETNSNPSFFECDFPQCNAVSWDVSLRSFVVKRVNLMLVQVVLLIPAVKSVHVSYELSKLPAVSLSHRQIYTPGSVHLRNSTEIHVLGLSCVSRFEYVPWLTCLKSHCPYANQVEGKFETHFLSKINLSPLGAYNKYLSTLCRHD